MADVDVPDEEDDLELKTADAGVMFRAEMWAQNTLLGYWPYLVGAVVVVLLCFLFYGQYNNYVTRTQRAASADVYAEVAKLPAPVEFLGQQKAYGMLRKTDAELVAAADKIAEAAEQGTGPAKVDGLINAAEVYRLGNATERQKEVLTAAAAEASVGTILWHAAQSRLATLELELEESDAAIQRLRSMREKGSDFLAQEAALELARVYEQLERPEDAAQVYEEFLRKWANSPRVEEVQTLRDRVSG